jgi:mannose-1-phosphate guanylyltransferase/mannose-6-phosphate isomerase
MNLYPVIMCGGSGTRLWPASRASRPKQFIALTGSASLFQDTVRRLQDLEGFQRLVIVAGRDHAGMVAAQLAELDATADVLLEPAARDSAPAMAAAAVWIHDRDPHGVAVFVASDHHIPDAAAFRAAVATAAQAAHQGRIVTLGIRPTEPSSAYGYIRPAEGVANAVTAVSAFVEKPERAIAEQYLTQGYLWNSGNFIVSAATLLSELDRYAPEVARGARDGLAQGSGSAGAFQIGDGFTDAPKISIDYAVMEKTDRASVLPVDLAWSDLGAWDAVKAVSAPDGLGNVETGETILIDSRDCIVRVEPGMVAAVVGVTGLAVVAERDAVLVCRIDQAQSVKAVVERLRAQSRPQFDVAPSSTLDLADHARRYRRWLFGAALPLWWAVGADHEGWGYFERIDLDGRPTADPRRARVQARQTYVYATAGTLGWSGPWRTAARHGLDGLASRYQRPDGLYRTLVAPDGQPADQTALLYDQAFALLALASVQALNASAGAEASALLDRVEASYRHPPGGFREAGGPPYQSNPHMHLLEACLAWIEAGGGARWEALASEVVDLALARFIDPVGGYLREFFAADWSPAPGDAGAVVEPGHQFEWAWLLERWARMTGDNRAAVAARRLFAVGRRGIDAVRGVAVDTLSPELRITDPRARLWPQTERLKAALILQDEPEARASAASLWRYIELETPGLWRDKFRADGSFAEEPAPASSLYHLVAAIAELERVVGG